MLASHASHGPFGPSDRQTEKKQGKEVGNEKGATVVLCCESGETKKISQADRTTCYSKNDPDR